MEKCEIVPFQLIEIRKMNIRGIIKIKYVTNVILSFVSSRMKFILLNRGEHIKVKRLPNVNKNYEKIQMIYIN